MSLLEVTGVKKIYRARRGGTAVEALKNVNFTVEKGEYVAIMGESGSGNVPVNKSGHEKYFSLILFSAGRHRRYFLY